MFAVYCKVFSYYPAYRKHGIKVNFTQYISFPKHPAFYASHSTSTIPICRVCCVCTGSDLPSVVIFYVFQQEWSKSSMICQITAIQVEISIQMLDHGLSIQQQTMTILGGISHRCFPSSSRAKKFYVSCCIEDNILLRLMLSRHLLKSIGKAHPVKVIQREQYGHT